MKDQCSKLYAHNFLSYSREQFANGHAFACAHFLSCCSSMIFFTSFFWLQKCTFAIGRDHNYLFSECYIFAWCCNLIQQYPIRIYYYNSENYHNNCSICWLISYDMSWLLPTFQPTIPSINIYHIKGNQLRQSVLSVFTFYNKLNIKELW